MSKDAARIARILRSIPAKIKPKIQAAVEQGATEMMMRMRYLAPTDDGDLQASIRVEDGPRELSATVTAGGERTTRPVRMAEKGNAPEYDYALGQEYGTEDMPAQPFFWPSVNTTKKRVRRRIDRAIGKAIKDEYDKS